MNRVPTLRADTKSGWKELARLVHTVDAGDALGRLRTFAFLQMERTATDEAFQPFVEDALPRMALSKNRSVHDRCAGVIYRSARPWAKAFIKRYVEYEQPGWQHFIDASWRYRKEIQSDWILELNTSSEAVLRHVARTERRMRVHTRDCGNHDQ